MGTLAGSSRELFLGEGGIWTKETTGPWRLSVPSHVESEVLHKRPLRNFPNGSYTPSPRRAEPEVLTQTLIHANFLHRRIPAGTAPRALGGGADPVTCGPASLHDSPTRTWAGAPAPRRALECGRRKAAGRTQPSAGGRGETIAIPEETRKRRRVSNSNKRSSTQPSQF